MAAQPVAHLYRSGWEPGDAWTYHQTLTVTVSCIPALVFGHLLHLAASPTGVRVVSRVVAVLSQDKDTMPVVPAVEPVVPATAPVVPAVPVPAVAPAVPEDTTVQDSQDTVPVPRPRVLKNGSMRNFVLDILSQGEDTPDNVIKDKILAEFDAEAKPNTMSKSISRARAALAQSA